MRNTLHHVSYIDSTQIVQSKCETLSTLTPTTTCLVGFAKLLEAILGQRVVRVLVRMQFSGQDVILLLDLLCGGGLGDPQEAIVVYDLAKGTSVSPVLFPAISQGVKGFIIHDHG